MDRIRRIDLDQLLEPRTGPCVSLYMPMHVKDRSALDDPKCLRDLCDQAEKALLDLGMRRPDACGLLRPIRELPVDNLAWQHRGPAIAVFAAPGFFRMFHLAGQIAPSSSVDDQFHLLPLLPHLMDEERFFVLAISQNAIRLLEGNATELREMRLAGAPRNLAEAIDIESPERGEQVHSATHFGTNKEAAVFHGQGGKPETIKSDLRQFLEQVAEALDRRLNDEQAPLIVATVEATVPIWRDVSRYEYLLDDFISGCPDHLSASELHAKAWPLVQPALARRRELQERRLRSASGAKTSFGIESIVPAAIGGRIQSLFIDTSRSLWGRYDAANHRAEFHPQRQPGDQDLVELAAVETLKHRGEVFPISPNGSNTAARAEALLRF